MSAAMRDDASTFDADVLVVGAGPVGQTLAIDLTKRGVSVLLIERRGNSVPADHRAIPTVATGHA